VTDGAGLSLVDCVVVPLPPDAPNEEALVQVERPEIVLRLVHTLLPAAESRRAWTLLESCRREVGIALTVPYVPVDWDEDTELIDSDADPEVTVALGPGVTLLCSPGWPEGDYTWTAHDGYREYMYEPVCLLFQIHMCGEYMAGDQCGGIRGGCNILADKFFLTIEPPCTFVYVRALKVDARVSIAQDVSLLVDDPRHRLVKNWHVPVAEVRFEGLELSYGAPECFTAQYEPDPENPEQSLLRSLFK
jgi:hypothetical protein